ASAPKIAPAAAEPEAKKDAAIFGPIGPGWLNTALVAAAAAEPPINPLNALGAIIRAASTNFLLPSTTPSLTPALTASKTSFLPASSAVA
ncbi:hypothetical protein FRB91_010513, partial [Serendipita sp. 411]